MARSSLRFAGLVTLALTWLLAALPVPSARAAENAPTILVDASVKIASDGSAQIRYQRTYQNETDQIQPVHELVRSPARDARGQTRGTAQVVESTALQTKVISTGVQINADLAAHTKAKLVVEFTLPPQAERSQQGIAWQLETMNLPVSGLKVEVDAPADMKLAPGPDQAKATVDGAGLPLVNALVVQNGSVSAINPSKRATGNGWTAEVKDVPAGAQVSMFFALERPGLAKPLDLGQVIFWSGSALMGVLVAAGIVWTVRRERTEKAKATTDRQKQRHSSHKR